MDFQREMGSNGGWERKPSFGEGMEEYRERKRLTASTLVEEVIQTGQVKPPLAPGRAM